MADCISAPIAVASCSSSRNLVRIGNRKNTFLTSALTKPLALTCMDFVKMTQDFFCAVLMAGIILFAYCIIFGNVL